MVLVILLYADLARIIGSQVFFLCSASALPRVLFSSDFGLLRHFH